MMQKLRLWIRVGAKTDLGGFLVQKSFTSFDLMFVSSLYVLSACEILGCSPVFKQDNSGALHLFSVCLANRFLFDVGVSQNLRTGP